MQAYSRRALVVLVACLLLFGCTFPLSAYAPGTPNPTDYVTTLSAMQTRAVMTATAQGVAGAPTQAPIPVSGGTPGTQMVLVINDTLCWRGPGPAYETVSAIFKGTHVQLLGRTVLPAWYIVLNPVYQDPCWVQASDVQVDQTLLASLPVYPLPATGLITPVQTATRRVPTPTPPVATGTPIPPTQPSGTSTPPPPTSAPPTPTPGAPTATQPAPTASQPAPTATQPAATQPAPTGTP